MKTANRLLLSLVAAGMAGGTASAALAQGTPINVSGATLLENWIKAPASTNDYLDVDGDGIAGIFSNGPDQLAPFDITSPFLSGQKWIVQYRVVGSVNGFEELLKFGRTFVTTDDQDINGLRTVTATLAYNNGALYIQNGVGVPAGGHNPLNPGGAPFRSLFSTLQGTLSSNPVTEGVRIDMAPLDVPSFWAVVKDGSTPDFLRKPPQLGYGLNPQVSRDKNGSTAVNNGAPDASQTGGLSSLLAALPSGVNFFDPANPETANANTIFDTSFAFAVIAPIVNYGVGLQQATMTELRHMLLTGRTVTGENLMIVTRDVGSGTRNALYNCIGLDPSWGNGENIGGLSTLSVNNNLGPAWTPTNKGGNSGVEATVQNHRLAVGYAGAERGVTGTGRGSWLVTNRNDILAIQNDLYGGTEYSRPHISEVLPLNANGYVIGGPAVLATFGDPRNQNEIGGDTGNTRPRLRNPQAAAYLNNFSRSVEAFIALPGSDETIFSPGELAATQFILFPALQRLHNFQNPIQLDTNPNFNASLNTFTLANNRLNNSAFLSFNATNVGRVPTRTTGASVIYSDGVATGANYRSQGGVNVTYDTNLTLRNKIAGDFDGNGLRNRNDTLELLKAWRQRNGGPAWTAPNGTGPIAGAPGTDAIIEVIGDFDGNGSFGNTGGSSPAADFTDVRYFADGLAIDPITGLLDRAAGFAAVDSSWASLTGSSNFFGTTLTTGKSYVIGDSRGDVAKASGLVTPGYTPIGADGVINGFDIDYVAKQFKQNAGVTDGALNWDNSAEAAFGDLSADINGDLVVDQKDVCELVFTILGTTFGDVNLDGTANATDRNIVVANQGNAGGWAQGDVSGDGQINALDLSIVDGLVNVCCPADFNNDRFLSGDDFDAYVLAFELGEPTADFNGDGFVSGDDFDAFVAAFEAGCP